MSILMSSNDKYHDLQPQTSNYQHSPWLLSYAISDTFLIQHRNFCHSQYFKRFILLYCLLNCQKIVQCVFIFSNLILEIDFQCFTYF